MPIRTTRWAACSPGENPAPGTGDPDANECSLRSKATPNNSVAAPTFAKRGTGRPPERLSRTLESEPLSTIRSPLVLSLVLPIVRLPRRRVKSFISADMRYSSAMSTDSSGHLDQLSALAEPIRRRLYEYVVEQPAPVDRDEAAGALSIGRPLAAFHLDRLAEDGLLEVEFHRRSGRTGPGAGRPAKYYRRAAGRQLEVSLPPRRYSLAAEILADGLDRSGETGAADSVLDAARAVGDSLAASVATAPGREGIGEILRANGYEPFDEPDGGIRLRNCPFHALAERHRQLTCSMNFALLSSVAAQLPGAGLAAEPRPFDGACCVALVPLS